MSRELNLLPPERRRKLTRDSMMGNVSALLQTVLIGLVVVTICGAVMVAVLRVFTAATPQSKASELEQQMLVFEELRYTISQQNAVLELMHDTGDSRFVWTDFLHEMFSVIPPGVTVNRLNGRSGNQVRLSFTGQAITRTTLTVLEERLRQLDWVESVESPHANLIERENPSYTLNVVLVIPERAVEGGRQ